VLYALTLAGIPERILPGVLAALRERFTANHVFRGLGTPLASDGLTNYDEQIVGNCLRMAVDAVFKKTKRPVGFCRNPDRSCALKQAVGKNGLNCGKTDEETCFRDQPDFFMVLFQEGIAEEKLLKKLHHAAFLERLPKECYNKKEKTIEAIVSAIQRAMPVLGSLRRDISSTNSPLLLPPLNFRQREFDKLLKNTSTDPKSRIEQFKRKYFRPIQNRKSKKAYIGRNDLKFEPAETAGRHGIASDGDDFALVLSAAFRLGCRYRRDFHYDVMLLSGKDFGQSIQFDCRRIGNRLHVKGGHANITVDDLVL
jgi:hypothetical protein